MSHHPDCPCGHCASNRRHRVIVGLERYAGSGHEIGPIALAYIRALEAEVKRLGGQTPAPLRRDLLKDHQQ